MVQKLKTDGRKLSYKIFWFQPLHVDVPAVGIPVENLTLNQNFRPTYNRQEAYGRMDPIVTYKNTTRSISVNFSCQAHHLLDGPEGVVNNIRSINKLTQLLYPSYYGAGGNLAILNSPPFFRIVYGNYVGSFNPTGDLLGSESGLTGYITSFNHQLGKVARNVTFANGNDGYIRAVPREVRVSFSFEVVHDKLVGWHNNKFSPDGYGDNFPYNAGNFLDKEEAAAIHNAAFGEFDEDLSDTPNSKTTAAGNPSTIEEPAAPATDTAAEKKSAHNGKKGPAAEVTYHKITNLTNGGCMIAGKDYTRKLSQDSDLLSCDVRAAAGELGGTLDWTPGHASIRVPSSSEKE